MYPKRMVRQVLGAGMLTILILALTACGSGSTQEETKARPLPLHENAPLRPGEYHSVKFKPSLSFKVSKRWTTAAEQLSDYIDLGYLGGSPTGDHTGRLRFLNVKEVFKPGTTNVVEAPKDLVGWLQHHPYLTSKPEPVTLGGVKGEQLEVLVKDLPKDYSGLCGSDCVDIAPLSNDPEGAHFKEGYKRRVFVLEDVKGDTVMIWYGGPPDEFDEFAPEAQKVVDSVKWAGS